MGDLVWVRIFFPKPLVIELHTRHCMTGIPLQDIFSPRNQSTGYFL